MNSQVEYMPLVIVVALVVFLGLIVLVPVSMVLRFRTGTARRRGRGWLAAVNAWGFALSIAVLLTGAAVTTRWVPGAFRASLAGLAVGCMLGLAGLLLTRWERRPAGLHYTPNRWLVLAITVVVALRLLYGWLRAYHAWAHRAADASWLSQAGADGSLAAGAVVLGYYFTYWAGVRRQIQALAATYTLTGPTKSEL